MAGEPFSEDDLLDYVRGAASPALAERIEATMARDPAFKAEIALMRGLKPALEGADTGPSSAEFGWRRLEAEIRRDGAQPRGAPLLRQVAILRVAAVLLVIVGLGQAGYIASLLNTGEEPTYHTATKATEAYALGIAFAPEATAAEIGQLLRDADARVIDGPSALGLYRVAFGSAEALEGGQALFQASPLITLVAEE
jgi:anti-sigma factor RsiW